MKLTFFKFPSILVCSFLVFSLTGGGLQAAYFKSFKNAACEAKNALGCMFNGQFSETVIPGLAIAAQAACDYGVPGAECARNVFGVIAISSMTYDFLKNSVTKKIAKKTGAALTKVVRHAANNPTLVGGFAVLALVNIAEAAFVMDGTPFPPDIAYTEGNSSFPIFRDLRIANTTNTNSTLYRINLFARLTSNDEDLESIVFRGVNDFLKNASTAGLVYYFIGFIDDINAELSNLSASFEDLHENRDLYFALNLQEGENFDLFGANNFFGATNLHGQAINDKPFIEDGLELIMPFNGEEKAPQAIPGAIFGLFYDVDYEANPKDPGIVSYELTCDTVSVRLGTKACADPCIVKKAVAQSGLVFFQGNGNLYDPPICTVKAHDGGDFLGNNAQSSGYYRIRFNFNPKLKYAEKLWKYLQSPEGIVSVISAPLAGKVVFAMWKNRRFQVNSLAALVANKANISVFRFGERKPNGSTRGPEPVLGKWFTADFGSRFHRNITRIFGAINSNKKFNNDDEISALIARELVRPIHGICKPANKLSSVFRLGSFACDPNAITQEKIDEIARRIEHALKQDPEAYWNDDEQKGMPAEEVELEEVVVISPEGVNNSEKH